MKLSKETEQEIRQLYQAYWDAYLSGDFKTFASFLDDHIVIYGTAVGEIFSTKEEALAFYTATAEEMTGKAEFRNREISIQPVGDTIVIYEQSQLFILIEGTWTYYGFARITGIFEKKGNEWKLVHQHGSFPDSRTEEGQQIASEKIKEENLQLREAVQRRTVDLENKNRELAIESSLEKVRAVAMGMRKPDDMLEVCRMISEQLEILGVREIRNVQTAIFYPVKSVYINYEYYRLHQKSLITEVDYKSHPIQENFANAMIEGKGEMVIEQLTGQEVIDWVEYQSTTPQFVDTHLYNVSSLHYYWYSLGSIALGMSTYAPLTETDLNLFKRFRNVFDLAYRRYLDIEKAEAQAREAQIEAALERIRSRTMAMQKSDELKEVIQVVYDQFLLLKINIEHTGFIIDYKERNDMHIWLADIYVSPFQITIPYFDSPHWNSFVEAKAKGEDFFSNLLDFEEKNKFYADLFKLIPGLPEESKQTIFSKPGLAISTVLLDNVGLYIENFSGKPYSDDENATLMRFGKVFQQTYTRFLDLQKAEAQAREAQIENALEKIRSRTMAMQQSIELPEAANLLFQQVQSLGMPAWSAGYTLWDEDKKAITLWMSSEGVLQAPFRAPLTEDPSFIHFLESHQQGETLHVEEVGGEALADHYRYMRKLPGVGEVLDKIIEAGFQLPTFQIFHAAYFSQGFLLFITYEPVPGAYDIFRRFANVFDQTYTRFLDLQKAEAQTQKVKVEVALERVRARALAMQEPEELVEVAQVMRHEMGLLGIEELETSSIYIHDEGSDIADCWYAIKDIRVPEKKLVADHITMELHKTWVGREMLEFYASAEQQTSIRMQGANRIEWINYCSGISDVLEDFYGEVIPDRTYHLYKFSNGAIGAAAEGDISEESWELLRRATSVFSLAYSRFRDLTQARVDLEKLKTEKQRAEDALAHLKAAQTQLIQSEKMASLGELTAGIAHEIQNPLNFVNNFSDVNTELIEEMKEELQLGNNTEAIAIANDIADNEQKINHHGKRADAIVKGMLQHSRSSSGVKEPADINALCDEYLRLAYHGLRAKDKSFNATMKTDFDNSIGKVDIIPQDIGRVILNLITNAFYAVAEKAKMNSQTPYPLKGGVDFEPLVSVSTKLQVPLSGGRGSDGAMVSVSVSDNGPGIPNHLLDKIFQPFFTTKPTGQGTGLGLSLSYDIVKAHGGELKVETKEGEGSVFTIQLPVS